jgi:hypothetical protein
MGQEITHSHFVQRDFDRFDEHLRRETRHLRSWFEQDVFSNEGNVGGFELEAWLVHREGRPASIIEPFLDRLKNPLVVPELATFNVELNGLPEPLSGDALSRLDRGLTGTWKECNRVAQALDARLVMVGMLPTLLRSDLTLANMSPMQRYRALNEQILRLRAGRPLDLSIIGHDVLELQHDDVMLESAATSFQIHLKVTPGQAPRIYNAAKILSAPMVGIAANSPFLFGRDLWAETRIPLFEQAVAVGGSDRTKRVSFGIRYVEKSIMECFTANLERYPVLLPRVMDEPEETLPHLRLHNGTIWRWNRPLIGFDQDGTPHIRIEHRVVPSGPSVSDAIANTALFFGAVLSLAGEEEAPEKRLAFETARRNFYEAARHGLAAEVEWLDGKRGTLRELISDVLEPMARNGLHRAGVDEADIDHYLGIIHERAATRRNGATWQRAYVARHGPDMTALLLAYLEQQNSGRPVHEWPV